MFYPMGYLEFRNVFFSFKRKRQLYQPIIQLPCKTSINMLACICWPGYFLFAPLDPLSILLCAFRDWSKWTTSKNPLLVWFLVKLSEWKTLLRGYGRKEREARYSFPSNHNVELLWEGYNPFRKSHKSYKKAIPHTAPSFGPFRWT